MGFLDLLSLIEFLKKIFNKKQLKQFINIEIN